MPKICQQPNYPSTDEQINNMWYIQSVKYYSVRKKNYRYTKRSDYQTHCVKQKSDAKVYILSASIYMKF